MVFADSVFLKFGDAYLQRYVGIGIIATVTLLPSKANPWPGRGRHRKADASSKEAKPGPRLFQPEREEGVHQSASSSSKRPFDPESEEEDESCSEEGGGTSDEVKVSSFNFGWAQIHNAAKAHFLREISVTAPIEKKKRPYDNTNRQAAAAYKRTGTKLKENGLSSLRISSVLSQAECLCGFD